MQVFDSETAAKDNMKSKLPGSHNKGYMERPDGAYVTRLSRAIQVFDSVTAAEDNMKIKLPGSHNKSYRKRPHGTYVTRLHNKAVYSPASDQKYLSLIHI